MRQASGSDRERHGAGPGRAAHAEAAADDRRRNAWAAERELLADERRLQNAQALSTCTSMSLCTQSDLQPACGYYMSYMST